MAGSISVRGRGRQPIANDYRAGSLKVFLNALALGVLLASSVSAQPIPDTILLPDSLGPLYEPYHLAVGGSSDCIYVASESTDIIVVDANTYARIKRIMTGTPVGDACLVARHDRLYCSYPAQGRVAVIDCATNTIVRTIQVGAGPKRLCYNTTLDKLYCENVSDGAVTVIDCASDSAIAVVHAGFRPGPMAWDAAMDKLYVATEEALVAIDCVSDTVVARITSVPAARALCCSRRNRKLYAIGRHDLPDTLYVLSTPRDSMLARLYGLHRRFSTLLACNDSTDRVYAMDSVFVTDPARMWIIDGTGDTVIKRRDMRNGYYLALACDPARNLLYFGHSHSGFTRSEIDVVDGATLDVIASPPAGFEPSVILLDAPRERLLCASARRNDESRTLISLNSNTHDYDAVVPLQYAVQYMCCDSVHHRLYYPWGWHPAGVGVVDGLSNRVVAHIYAPTALYRRAALDEVDNKLYCATETGLLVVDCTGDSVLRRIDWGAMAGELCWFSGLNRLYCYYSPDGGVAVVDCSSDSLIDVISTPGRVNDLILAGRQERLFSFYDGGFQVISCGNDSVLVDSMIDWNVQAYAYVPDDNKLYASAGKDLFVYNVSPFRRTRSLYWPFAYFGNPQTIEYSKAAQRIYWSSSRRRMPDWVRGHIVVDHSSSRTWSRGGTGGARSDDARDGYRTYVLKGGAAGAEWRYSPYADSWGDSIRVLDTRSDSFVAVLGDTFFLTTSCVSSSGRFFWYSSYNAGGPNAAVAYDVCADTLVAACPMREAPMGIWADHALARVYVGLDRSGILAFSDSVNLGLAGGRGSPGRTPRATVQAAANVRLPGRGPWYDVTGRRVATLTLDDGRGDLRTGVYLSPHRGETAAKIIVVR